MGKERRARRGPEIAMDIPMTPKKDPADGNIHMSHFSNTQSGDKALKCHIDYAL